MTTVAIITARGGSKRIPRKNVRPFLGAPIITYSIRAALEAGCFDEVMVSTDDAEIAEIGRAAGAAVPFMRSAATSHDYATTAEALIEVLEQYGGRGRHFDTGCCLYPAAPFITADALRAGAHLLATDPALDAVVPVVRFGYPIQRALKIENNRLSMIWPENLNARSQDFPGAYHDAGQFYWFRVAAFLPTRRLFAPVAAPIILPEWAAQDIDTEEDWLLAEAKYQIFRRRQGAPGHHP